MLNSLFDNATADCRMSQELWGEQVSKHSRAHTEARYLSVGEHALHCVQ
jgi:hypothetical protein